MVRGVLDAKDLRAHGEVRLAGARVDGNIDVRGAQLAHPGGDALQASGVQVGGNLRSDRLQAQGRIVLAGAVVAGNAVFSGAMLHGTTDPGEHAVLVLPRGGPDPSAALVADRLQVRGNLVLDAGFTATGTVRLTNAQVGGYLQLSGASLGSPVQPSTTDVDQPRPVPVALAADGIEVRGDLDARPSTADGHARCRPTGRCGWWVRGFRAAPACPVPPCTLPAWMCFSPTGYRSVGRCSCAGSPRRAQSGCIMRTSAPLWTAPQPNSTRRAAGRTGQSNPR